jgi:hypothetical protein
MNRDIYFWLVQARGWHLLFYLIDAQAIPTFSNDRCVAVAMGRQESNEQITEVGVAFWSQFNWWITGTNHSVGSSLPNDSNKLLYDSSAKQKR